MTIPEDVTKIEGEAFGGCTNLTSVTIPDGVVKIEDRAFRDCKGLTSVTIPEGIIKIGNGVFEGCTGLTGVAIPESVMEIGKSAFKGCTGLTSVTIPERVKKIGKSVFSDCYPVLIAPHIPISGFDAVNKPGACAGFAKLYFGKTELDEEIKADYLKYIKGKKTQFYPLAVEHEALLQIMFAEKMIPRKDIDPLLEECDQQNNIAAKAAVLEYVGKSLEPMDPLKEFKLKNL